MTRNHTDQTLDRLALRSRLPDMAQVPAWVTALVARHSIPENVEFAMNLCLEEAISNIIRHGYTGAEDRSVIVRFTMPRDAYFVFVVDDEAPRFNPLEAPELPPLRPGEEIRVGGQGIRLMRRFADAIEYQPTPAGNRLLLGFSAAGPAVQAK